MVAGVLAVGLLVATGGPAGAAAPASASAAPAAAAAAVGRLQVAPRRAIAGERLVFRGRLPVAAGRTVVLQVSAPAGWRARAVAQTRGGGRFRISLPATRRVGETRRYRVVVAGRARVHTPVRGVVTVAQGAVLRPVRPRATALPFELKARFWPVRPGRPVRIQQRSAGGWTTVADTVQDDRGAARVELVAPTEAGRVDYRATTRRHRGAAGHVVAGSVRFARLCVAQRDVPVAECDALEALYASTNGPQWEDGSGWTTSLRVCRWSWVSCRNGHVSHLYLDHNEMSGQLPPEIGDLTRLRYLELSFNGIGGPVPPEIGRLQQLHTLYLEYNGLTSVPDELGQLVGLRILYLDANTMTGDLTGWARPLFEADHLEQLGLTDGYPWDNCFSVADDPDLIAWLQGHDPDWTPCVT